ncbi:universal stress protein [Xanthomarina spongicola]|uniref:Nucleotide-binding universal stress UspA family protein n=1 Tax=Xanthomarina spongicola TaxID=570520 RepID=A0A316DQ07_9FLAO|nr:universal stress protein [Xanthomarina spongicola]PWK19856.1 nucleotide-binding universal stress UspA family protein [Xanthomarina spongicola]
MKKILLPTDFSENSWEATLYALKLFKDQACTFYIMHSLEPLVSAPSTGVSSKRAYDAIIKSRLNESNLELEKELDKIHELPKNNKHTFETMIVHDYFLSAVHSTVKKLNCDVVILGTKGASGIKEMTIGSNTANLINKQTCTIIAVPENSLSKDMLEIGFASDFSIGNYGNELDLLKEIATTNASRISLVHIVNKNGEMTTELRANKLALEMALNPLPMDFYRITDVAVELGIRVFSESRNLGMLCIINKKRSFFENLFRKSNSKSISSHINVPLIIFNHSAF